MHWFGKLLEFCRNGFQFEKFKILITEMQSLLFIHPNTQFDLSFHLIGNGIFLSISISVD